MEIVRDKVQEFLEHLEELLLGGSDPLRKAAYFGVIFNEPPLYTELLSGTSTLEPCISLNEIFERTQSLNVDISEKSWNQMEEYIWKWFPILKNRHELALS